MPNKEQFNQIVNSPIEEITLDQLKIWFTDGRDRKKLIDPNERYEITKDLSPLPVPKMDDETDRLYNVRHSPNWGKLKETTAGRVVANAVILARPRLRAVVPFVNKAWDSKVLKDIQQQILDAAIENKITHKDLEWSVNAIQWLGYSTTAFISPSINIDLLRPSKRVRKLKSKLERDYADEIADGDMSVAFKIEKELLDAVNVEQQEKPNTSFDLFKSGARGSLPNNGKNTFLMRGVIKTFSEPDKVNISMASLEEGIPKDEFHLYSDLLVQASFGRSAMTERGGYLAKQLVAAFQCLKLHPDPESDCGTKDTLKVLITNPKDFRYRFVKTRNGNLVEITRDNEDEYRGVEVNIRTPLYCKDFKYMCSKCVGTFYYRLGTENIGVHAWRVGNVLLNAYMKAFHDMTLKYADIDVNDYLREVPLSSIR